MTLLGTGGGQPKGGFAVGSNDPSSSMGKSLDEMIKERRKDQKTASRRPPQKASNADRSIATGRAKRSAAIKAKRGISSSQGGGGGGKKKPDAMEVEREVYRQSRKTAAAKKASEKKATSGRIAPNSSLRDKKKKAPTKKNDPPAAVFGGRTPSKKAVEAAIKGMEAAGFKVPQGHQVMMTFVPVAVAPPQTSSNKGKKGGGSAGKGGKGGRKGK